MRRILAIDWDCREARAVVLDHGVASSRLVQAVSVAIEADGKPHLSAGRALAQALDGEALGKAHTVMAAGRDHLQLKRLQLPPAPAAEVPELARFKADRELTVLGDGAVFDFVPLCGGEQEPYQILAAALSAEGLAAAHSVAQTLRTPLKHATVRGLAAASLLRRATTDFDPHAVAMLVCSLAEEADIAVVADSRVVLLRTVRLPGIAAEVTDDKAATETVPNHREAGAAPNANGGDRPTDTSIDGMMAVGLDHREATLACEMRRTLASAHQQLGDRRVEIIYVCGEPDTVERQTALLTRQFELPCVPLDPFEAAAATVSHDHRPQSAAPNRFAAVLGMALDEAENREPAIDFLKPDRRGEERQIRRVHVLAGVAAVALLLAVGWHLYRQLALSQAETARLRDEIQRRQEIVDQNADIVAQSAEIESWLASDVNWLDEFERLGRHMRPEVLQSPEFPAATDAVVTRLNVTTSRGDYPTMTVTAASRPALQVASLEERLRDSQHIVIGPQFDQTDESVPGYPTKFIMSVRVLPATEGGQGETTP